jgi:pimeloyl-ACP methyl ester carboxylesterase
MFYYRAGQEPSIPYNHPIATPPVGNPAIEPKRTVNGNDAWSYYIYRPANAMAGAPLFVTVHGISRNAAHHVKHFARLADRYGVVVVAPFFPEDRFPNYQRLWREGRGDRADLALQSIIEEAGDLTGATTEKVYLFGYSGGGQFVHRYTMAYPQHVAQYAVGAAGWYTFPDTRIRYPRGIKPRPDMPGVTFDMSAFLAVRGGVVVGADDNKRDRSLNKSALVTAQQGEHRLERAQSWVQAMTAAAHRHDLNTDFFLHVLPHCGHSFSRSMGRGDMGSVVFTEFFSPDRDLGEC